MFPNPGYKIICVGYQSQDQNKDLCEVEQSPGLIQVKPMAEVFAEHKVYSKA